MYLLRLNNVTTTVHREPSFSNFCCKYYALGRPSSLLLCRAEFFSKSHICLLEKDNSTAWLLNWSALSSDSLMTQPWSVIFLFVLEAENFHDVLSSGLWTFTFFFYFVVVIISAFPLTRNKLLSSFNSCSSLPSCHRW